MSAVYKIAQSYLGLEEIPGSQHNEEIIQFFKDSGHAWVKDDETPWCAAFVNSVLASAGVKGTGKINARSFLNWGEEVPLSEAQQGDIVVFWRKNKSGPYGHVAFFDRENEHSIRVLGGNQNNRVCLQSYKKERLLSVRRLPKPKPPRKLTQSKTMQMGASQITALVAALGAFISDLDKWSQHILIASICLTGICSVLIMRERLRKWALGNQ
jgi:uncharacterized protein (TIGR02594 family)